MRKLITVLCMSLLVVSMADAQGLLHKRRIEVWTGVARPGDREFKEIDDTISMYGAQITMPACDILDLYLSYSHQEASGKYSGERYFSEARILRGGLVLSMGHYGPVEPYLSAAIGEVEVEWDQVGYSFEVEDDLKRIALGAECSVDDKSAVTPAVIYTSYLDDEDTGFAVRYNRWLTDNLAWSGSAAYWFDSEDIVGSVSAIFAW